MQTTTNIGLKTYEANDPTDWLGEFNYNMNKIDTAVGVQNDAIDVIEETANTAVSTANTASTTATDASTTATQALDVANSKPSINDTVAGTTSTYSSNKINDLISGIVPDATTRKILDFINLPFNKNNYTIGASSDNDYTIDTYSSEALTYTTTEDTIIFGHFDFHNDPSNTSTNYCGVAYDLANPETQLADSMFYSDTYTNYVFNTPIRIVPANTTVKLYVKVSGVGTYYVKNPKIYIKKISEL